MELTWIGPSGCAPCAARPAGWAAICSFRRPHLPAGPLRAVCYGPDRRFGRHYPALSRSKGSDAGGPRALACSLLLSSTTGGCRFSDSTPLVRATARQEGGAPAWGFSSLVAPASATVVVLRAWMPCTLAEGLVDSGILSLALSHRRRRSINATWSSGRAVHAPPLRQKFFHYPGVPGFFGVRGGGGPPR